MIRIIAVLALLVSISANAYANVYFKWNSLTTGEAKYWNNYPAEPKTYANTPNGWTVLTYISGDTTVNFDTGSTFASSYGSGAGADTYIGAAVANIGGRYTTASYTVGAAGSGAGSYVGSYAYLVLVAMSYSTFTNSYAGDISQLPVNTRFGVSGTSAALVQHDPDPPAQVPAVQLLNVGTVRADIALVPEPSTFALLGIGLGLVGLRRFRRK